VKRVWIIIAGLCLLVAATFLWWRRTDIAFVAATLGALSWLMNYRTGIKESIAPATVDEPDDEWAKDSNED
jgi:hypothetical protein